MPVVYLFQLIREFIVLQYLFERELWEISFKHLLEVFKLSFESCWIQNFDRLTVRSGVTAFDVVVQVHVV